MIKVEFELGTEMYERVARGGLSGLMLLEQIPEGGRGKPVEIWGKNISDKGISMYNGPVPREGQAFQETSEEVRQP